MKLMLALVYWLVQQFRLFNPVGLIIILPCPAQMMMSECEIESIK